MCVLCDCKLQDDLDGKKNGPRAPAAVLCAGTIALQQLTTEDGHQGIQQHTPTDAGNGEYVVRVAGSGGGGVSKDVHGLCSFRIGGCNNGLRSQRDDYGQYEAMLDGIETQEEPLRQPGGRQSADSSGASDTDYNSSDSVR